MSTRKLPIVMLPDDLADKAIDLAETLVDHGLAEDAAAEAVAEFLDALVPLDRLVPGSIGTLLEAKDGDLFEALVKAVNRAFTVDPEKQEERRARRQARRAARQARRAAR